MRYSEIMEASQRLPTREIGPTLYHGTGCLNAADILQHKLIHASDDPHDYGVSMTDELSSAEYFAARTDAESWAFILHQKNTPDKEYYEDKSGAMDIHRHLTGVIFEFNTAKIAEHYRIKPIAYTGDWEDEAEWRVLNESIPLMPFLQGIHVKAEVVEWWMQNMPEKADSLHALLRY